ncbi:hypothetical protein R6Q57_018509 [Mikania cordata]
MYKFLYHTILQFLSQNSTSWGEMPYDMQYFMYAVLSNDKVNLSKIIFDHLVTHQKSPKFLLYPRFVMACLFADLNNACHIAPLSTINSIDKQVFTRLNTDPKQTNDTEDTPILGEPTSTSYSTPVKMHQGSPSHLAPHQSSQQDHVVLQREPSLAPEVSFDTQSAVHSLKDISASSPHAALNSPTHVLHEIDVVFQQLGSPPSSPI